MHLRYKTILIGLLALMLVCLVVGLLPLDAFARAGGGGGYSGGGGGGGGGFGGGGSGGGSGGGALIYFLIWLVTKHPVIGIPLVIAIIAFMIFSAKQADQGHRGRVIRRGNRAMDGLQRQQAVDQLRSEDAAFDESRFYDRVGQAFRQIQQAWSQQDLTSVRGFVSDGIYERFSLQFMEQRDFGYRPHVSNVNIQQMQLAQVSRDAFFDVVSVRIAASCIDFRVSLDSGQYVSGNRQTEAFVEYWTFLRRRGVQTQDRPGLIEGSCPNCGADIRLNQSAKCPSCDSLLRSGQFDWVMSEITQECEWYGGTPEQLPGAVAYRQADPGFNVQHLEDRASVVFWRKVMADRLGQIAPLLKMATSEFCQQYAVAPQAGDGQRRYIGDCAVGSVDARGVFRGDPEDTALVEVRWSGTQFTTSTQGPPRRSGRSVAARTLFVFSRNRGTTTDVGSSVSSSHCPGCGAPEESLTSHACEFCGEVLNDGSHDWVLNRILAMSSTEAQGLLRQANQQTGSPDQLSAEMPLGITDEDGPTPHGMELLAWAVKMALADNHLDDRERAMLQRVARHRRIPPEQLETLIQAAEQGQLDVPQPADKEQARRWLGVMADISVSDGKIEAAEYKLLCQAGAQLNLVAADIKLLLRKRQTQLYRTARQQLRQARTGPVRDRRP